MPVTFLEMISVGYAAPTGVLQNTSSDVATAAISANKPATKKMRVGGKPTANKYPPKIGATIPPSRPMPSAHPMPLVRMRAG